MFRPVSFSSARLVLSAVFCQAALGRPESAESPGVAVLEPVVVVGSRLGEAGDHLADGVVSLDRDYIALSGATNLSELLERLPQSYGGAGSGSATVPNGSPAYGNAQALFNFSGASAPLRQTGVSSVGLRGLGAGGTLVLVDGRRLPLSVQEDTASSTGTGFYDLSTIPLGLVERVEVLPSGASAIYGSDAVGGVVNIVLKNDYTGAEFETGFRAAEAGGGFERHATLTAGVTRERFNVLIALTGSRRDALKASQRGFSSSQDLTTSGGFDYRLSIGSPAVVGAVAGNLNGVTTPGGGPANFALVPAGQDGTGLVPGDFTGANGFTAAGLRRFATSEYKDLIGAEDMAGLSLAINHALSPVLDGFARLSHSSRSTVTANEPPATLAGGFGGAGGLVPAGSPFNPFGQDVIVSMVHVEAPARSQTVDVDSTRFTLGLEGRLPADWEWSTAATYSREVLDSRTQELDPALFDAALVNGTFNPFGDPSTGPINAALYPDLKTEARIEGVSDIVLVQAGAQGPVFALPGGDARLALGAESLRATRRRESTDPLFGQPAVIDSARTNTAFYGELHLPLAGGGEARAGLHRVSLSLAARHERADVFAETSPSIGLQWAPVPAITFFGKHAGGFRAPSLTEIEDTTGVSVATVNDPMLGTSYATNVVGGGNPDVGAETSRTWQFGFVLTPPALPGLSLRVASNETYFDDKLTTLAAQTIVNAEGLFPGRVTRGGAGTITSVNATTINYGQIYTRSVDVSLAFDREFPSVGRVMLQVDASRLLEFSTLSTPAAPATTLSGGDDTGAPPAWKVAGSARWVRGAWDAGAFVTYLGGFESNATGAFLDAGTRSPAWTVVDVRVGYRFRNGLWRGWGRDARIQVGVGNIADRQPPFANTVYGYNQSLYSPLGRTYDLSVRMPF
ncbi:MAG: TonB-dependent receptor [Verrucomicrobiota bacterium]